jgi:hypothetical protein
MSTTTKTRSLITIIIFLLITNIAMLIFFVLLSKPTQKKPRSRENSGMNTALQKEVGFSADQLGRYQALRKEQMKKVRPLFNEVRNAKNDFYDLVYADHVTDSMISNRADSIAEKQRILDMQMFMYFRNIRGICTGDQVPKFDSSIKRVIQRMVGRTPGKENAQHKK